MIIGKSGEKLFGSSCKDLVMNQRLVDQHQLLNEFLRLIGQKKKKNHLRFGTRKNNLNTNDLLISNVSEDNHGTNNSADLAKQKLQCLQQLFHLLLPHLKQLPNCINEKGN